jgi:hypothetical protein
VNTYPQHNVSDNGQVFFETLDSLLRRDTNDRRDDVYEYEKGQLRLISTGTEEADSRFLDATPDGSDVFFGTAERLLPRDIDATYDYYDARIGGGFAEAASPAPPCGAGSCHGSDYAAPGSVTPGTDRFVGPGNLQGSAGCRVLAKRVQRLRHRASRLRRRAGGATELLRKAKDLAVRADRLSRHAKHCRSASQGVGR